MLRTSSYASISLLIGKAFGGLKELAQQTSYPRVSFNMHMPKLYNVYFLASIATVGGML